jgi:hypothetical protein
MPVSDELQRFKEYKNILCKLEFKLNHHPGNQGIIGGNYPSLMVNLETLVKANQKVDEAAISKRSNHSDLTNWVSVIVK